MRCRKICDKEILQLANIPPIPRLSASPRTSHRERGRGGENVLTQVTSRFGGVRKSTESCFTHWSQTPPTGRRKKHWIFAAASHCCERLWVSFFSMQPLQTLGISFVEILMGILPCVCLYVSEKYLPSKRRHTYFAISLLLIDEI